MQHRENDVHQEKREADHGVHDIMIHTVLGIQPYSSWA